MSGNSIVSPVPAVICLDSIRRIISLYHVYLGLGLDFTTWNIGMFILPLSVMCVSIFQKMSQFFKRCII